MMTVEPGYEIGRDGRGLTKREREVLALLVEQLNLVQIGERLGVSKQRAEQLVKSLEKKGIVQRHGDEITIVVKRTV
jgi:DNA-binding CsgD family transcriptional regulator